MATLVIGIDDGRKWQTPLTDAEIVELGRQYEAHETSLDPAARLPQPTLTDISAALAVAQGGLEAARREDDRRAIAATELHHAMGQATPLLIDAFEQLKWQHRANLSELRTIGLTVKTGANGKELVARPRTEAGWATFLLELVKYDETLPADQRIIAGTLLPLKGLAGTVQDNQVERREAKSARKLAVETRSETAGPLLDLLQLAFGLLVVTRFNRRVTTALEPWGFKIKVSPDQAAPEPTEPTA